MKCFYHQAQDAVGLCKSCLKGICVDCAVDLGKGLGCRGSCEADVKNLMAVIESNMRISPIGTKVWGGYGANQLLTAAITIVLGALFAVWAALQDPPLLVIMAMGAVFALWGAAQAVQALRLRRTARESNKVA